MITNILGLDLGTGSLGIAISRSGVLITPLTNIRFRIGDYDQCIQLFQEVVRFEKIEHIVIGLPTYPSGDPSEMSEVVEKFILRLEVLYPNCDIIRMNEQNSTLEASEMLHSMNMNSKKQRKYIDSAAAMVILKRYLKQINQY